MSNVDIHFISSSFPLWLMSLQFFVMYIPYHVSTSFRCPLIMDMMFLCFWSGFFVSLNVFTFTLSITFYDGHHILQCCWWKSEKCFIILQSNILSFPILHYSSLTSLIMFSFIFMKVLNVKYHLKHNYTLWAKPHYQRYGKRQIK